MGDIAQAEFALPDSTTPPVATPAAPSNRPQGLPEKFNSIEDLAKAYKELESKLGAPQEPEQPAVETPPQAPAPTPDLSQIGTTKYAEEFAAYGTLSEASYAELAAKGITKDVVDKYIEGQQAAVEVATQQVLKDVGGTDGYKSLLEWASTALNDAEKKAYNVAVTNPDPAVVKLAIDGLAARKASAVGVKPNLVGGVPGGAGGPKPYESQAQMLADIGNPLYSRDPAFRNKVMERIAVSNV